MILTGEAHIPDINLDKKIYNSKQINNNGTS